MRTIELTDDTRVLVLTGAGISAESGVPTFRDAGGLWEGHRFEDVASPDAFARDPRTVWRFYSQRRAGLDGIVPNPGHHAVAGLEQRLGDRMLLVTQNVDGLHAAAGSRRIVELHGNIMKSRCSSCDRPPFADTRAHEELPPCDQCGELLRPHIVWFGEMIDPEHLATIGAFLRRPGPLVFVAVGTSGMVEPAASFVDAARRAGGSTWLVNLDRPANAERFDHVLLGKSGEILPSLFGL